LNDNANVITDLSLLDKFIVSYNSTENYFRSTNEKSDNGNTIPYMSGDIFVNNSSSNPISEYALKNTYKDIYFPDLNIFVANVEPAYTAKFIQVQDNGQEIEWDVHKYDPETTTHPSISTKENPQKLHYDFVGWSTDKNGTKEDVLTEEEFAELTFSNSKTVYTFYAIFEIHKYWVRFKNYNNNPADENDYDFELLIESGKPLYEPTTYLPYKPSDDLADDKVYKFIGYSSESDGSMMVDLTDFLAVKNYTFYNVYEITDVRKNVIDSKYFTFTEYNYIDLPNYGGDT